MIRPSRSLDRAGAQEIAIRALHFLAADEERLARFLALTGLGPGTIRAASAAPGFLVAVVDHVLGDEEELVAFAQGEGLDPQIVAEARTLLAPADPDGSP